MLAASTRHASATSAGLMALAAVALVGAAVALLTRPSRLTGLTARPLRRRATALRRKSWAAAFQRQLNPDAAGRARARAPSSGPGGRLTLASRLTRSRCCHAAASS